VRATLNPRIGSGPVPFPERMTPPRMRELKQASLFSFVVPHLDRLQQHPGLSRRLHSERISNRLTVVNSLAPLTESIERAGRVALETSGPQRSRLKFVVASFPVPKKLFEVQQRKKAREITGVYWCPLVRAVPNPYIVKSLLPISKKNSCICQDCVIFLALLWFRDYGNHRLRPARSEQMGPCAGPNASGYRRSK